MGTEPHPSIHNASRNALRGLRALEPMFCVVIVVAAGKIGFFTAGVVAAVLGLTLLRLTCRAEQPRASSHH